MTYTYTIYNQSGGKVSDQDVNASLFNEENISPSLVHEYVVMYLSNQRQSGAHTKTRGEVKRSGKKLYRQKGTGSARVGDAGSPIRRKGGVVFGPRSEKNYHKDMPKKMKKRALLSSLILKFQENGILGLDAYSNKEGKTRTFLDFLGGIEMEGKKILVVLPEINEVHQRSIRNIDRVSYTTSSGLNTYELMTHKHVLFIGDSFQKVEERLA